jgi:hypothetical protein
MLTRLGRPNKPSSMGERLGSIIPLEDLPTGTRILDMHALPHIKVVMKFSGASRAAHGVIPFCWCVPLLAHAHPIIRHLFSKRSQKISVICLDIGIRSPYNFFAPIVDFLSWEVPLRTGPDLPPDGSGLRSVTFESLCNNLDCATFSCTVCPNTYRATKASGAQLMPRSSCWERPCSIMGHMSWVDLYRLTNKEVKRLEERSIFLHTSCPGCLLVFHHVFYAACPCELLSPCAVSHGVLFTPYSSHETLLFGIALERE